MTDGPATPSKSKADTGRDIFTNGSTPAGGPTTGSVQDYEEWKFAQYVVQKIREHDPEIPLFFNYDFHIVHEPLDVPEVYEAAQQKLTTYPGKLPGCGHICRFDECTTFHTNLFKSQMLLCLCLLI